MSHGNHDCQAQATLRRSSTAQGKMCQGRARFVALLALSATAACATALRAGAAEVREVTVADFAAPQQPRIALAGENMAATPAGFSASWLAEGAASAGAARLSYDFSQGVRRALIPVSGFFPSQTNRLNFSVRAPGKTVVSLRLIDAKNESFWGRLDYTGTAAWQTLSADLTDPALWMHGFRAPDDGILDQPLRGVEIGLTRSENPLSGTFDLDQVTAVTALDAAQLEAERAAFAARPAPPAPAPPAAPQAVEAANTDPRKVPFRFRTAVAGNLFYPADAVKATLSASAVALERLSVRARVLDARDALVAELPPLALSQNSGFSASLDLPKALGFYRITLQVEGKAHPFEARYAVIPAHPMAGKDPASPFGVNTHFNQSLAGRHRSHRQARRHRLDSEGQPSHTDQAVSVARANGLAYLPVFTWYPRPMDKNKRPDGTWDFSDVAAWHRRYAQLYGADIDYYDLVNEPHHN